MGKITNGVADATGRELNYGATDTVGKLEGVDFLIFDGRDEGTVNVVKKSKKDFPAELVERAVFVHALGFMLVAPANAAIEVLL